VISHTLGCFPAFSCDTKGDHDGVRKCNRPMGTTFSFNSARLTFIAPSNLAGAVTEETTYAIIRFKFAKLGLSASNLFVKHS
jgi:hypothetical protein